LLFEDRFERLRDHEPKDLVHQRPTVAFKVLEHNAINRGQPLDLPFVTVDEVCGDIREHDVLDPHTADGIQGICFARRLVFILDAIVIGILHERLPIAVLSHLAIELEIEIDSVHIDFLNDNFFF
jgi:hypothetical protein